MNDKIEKLNSLRDTPLEQLSNAITQKYEISLYVKRDDLIHPYITGNKWRKLKYNLIEAINKEYSTLLTFGGAYSNHIYATAAAGAEFNLKTIGVIRGEKPSILSPTLKFAMDCGMQLHFVSRDSYSKKDEPNFIAELNHKFDNFYILPEGGTNTLSLKGVKEIYNEINIPFDYLCSSVGTGGTVAGLSSASSTAKIMGFSSLKGGEFLEGEVKRLLKQSEEYDYNNREWILDYHFGGYGKFNDQLVD